MATFQNSQLNKVEINSAANSTGAISTTDISADGTSLDSSISDNETTPSGQTIFTVSRLEGEIVVNDMDFLFTDTMDSGNTVETAMNNRTTVYVRLTLEGGVIQESGGSDWIEVRPVTEVDYNPATDDALVSGVFRFTHPDSGGTQRPA
jgi:hypothetical protein